MERWKLFLFCLLISTFSPLVSRNKPDNDYIPMIMIVMTLTIRKQWWYWKLDNNIDDKHEWNSENNNDDHYSDHPRRQAFLSTASARNSQEVRCNRGLMTSQWAASQRDLWLAKSPNFQDFYQDFHSFSFQISPDIPSGKLTVCYGKSPCLMGKSTINGHFQ